MTLTQITEKGIKDGEIINADINASAAIAGTKIAPNFGSQNIVTTGTAATGALTIDGPDTATGSGGPTALSLKQGDANNEFVNLSFQTGSGGPLGAISAVADATGVYPNTTGQLRFSTQVGGGLFERMFIKSDGKIGIGTTSPSGKFHVEDSGEVIAYIVGNTSSAGSRLVLQNKNTTANSYTGVLGADAGGHTTAQVLFYSADDTNNEGYLTLETRPSGGLPTERMRIDSSGNVGIGTTSPAQLFHVNGQAKVNSLGVGQDAGSSTLAITGNMAINTTGNTTYSKFNIAGSGVTTGSAFTINNYGDVEGDYYHFGVNSTQNASGNTSKTNDAKRSSAVTLDGRMGRVIISTSQTSTSTIDDTFTFDRSGNFTLTGNVVVADGKGIDFSATAGPTNTTGASELLDDYEEGTWTPAYGSSSVPTSTYVNTGGRYTKVGKLVTVTGRIQMSASTTNSGALTIGGFPFSCENSVFPGGIHFIYNDNWYGGSSGDTAQVTFMLVANASYGYFYNGDGDNIGASSTYDNAKRIIHFTGSYLAA